MRQNNFTNDDIKTIYNKTLYDRIRKRLNIGSAGPSGTKPREADEPPIPKEAEEPTTGSGLRRNRIMIGRGVAILEDTPKYKEFGKYAIHWPQLINNDILNVKYKSLGRIPTLLPVAISDIFKDFIIDVVETGKINNRLYEMVPPEEKKYFEKVCIGAGLLEHFKLKKTVINEDMEDIKRFNILKGEYLAGNNNTQLIKELRRLIIKFINNGRIHKTQGMNFLMELSL